MAFLLFCVFFLPAAFIAAIIHFLSSAGGNAPRPTVRIAAHNSRLERETLGALARKGFPQGATFKIMLAESVHHRVSERVTCPCLRRRSSSSCLLRCSGCPGYVVEPLRVRLTETMVPCCLGVPIRAFVRDSESPAAAFCGACGRIAVVSDDDSFTAPFAGIADLRSHLGLGLGEGEGPYR